MKMVSSPPSRKAMDILFHDAIRRDIATARRTALLRILWNERFLTRSQLIVRVEYQLEKICFGLSAWEDAFYRGIWVVKQAFRAAGLTLEYSRDKNKKRPGYYIREQDALSPEFKNMLRASAAEVDQRQIDIYRRLSPAARFRQGCAISDTARNVVAFRIRQEDPFLTAGSQSTGFTKVIHKMSKKTLDITGFLKLILEALETSKVEYMIGGFRPREC